MNRKLVILGLLAALLAGNVSAQAPTDDQRFFRLRMGLPSVTTGELLFYHASHAYSTTVRAHGSAGGVVVITLPATTGTLLIGDLGATDTALLRANGTASGTAQGSAITVTDGGSIVLPATTTSDTGIWYRGGVRWLHSFSHPTGGGAVPNGRNIFLGESAGNFTVGSTATVAGDGSYNIGIGYGSLLNLTLGNSNVMGGYAAGENVTTGYSNSGWGHNALRAVTTSFSNTGVGTDALYGIATGSGANTGVGVRSGRYLADGVTLNTTGSQGLFLGALTKALADGSTNEIVIGYGAVGLGSNTAIVGNSSITKTQVNGGLLTKTLIEANTAGSGSPHSLAAEESRLLVINQGVTAEGYQSLPAAAAGLQYCVAVQDADGIRVTAAAGDTIRIRDKVTVSGGYIRSTTIGSVACVRSLNTTEWFGFEVGGVWTDDTWTYDDTGLTTP